MILDKPPVLSMCAGLSTFASCPLVFGSSLNDLYSTAVVDSRPGYGWQGTDLLRVSFASRHPVPPAVHTPLGCLVLARSECPVGPS